MSRKHRLILIVSLSWGGVVPSLILPYSGVVLSLAFIGYCYWAASQRPVEGLPVSRVRLQFLLLLPPTILVALMRSLDQADILSDVMFDIFGGAWVAAGAIWIYAAAYLHQRLSRLETQ